jgi:hypothetical protein
MKKILTILVLLLAWTNAFCQEGLYVEDLFEGRVIPAKLMKRTTISGSKLQPYGLDTYKSLSFQVGEAAFHTVEVLIMKDSYAAIDQQTEYVGDHLVYAVISLPQTHTGLNRFLCYQAKEDKGIWDVTVVYLRGTATVGDLDMMFNKRKK